LTFNQIYVIIDFSKSWCAGEIYNQLNTESDLIDMLDTVPLCDLKRIDVNLLTEIQEIVSGVISSGSYIHGFNHQLFEKEFAEYCGVRNCIGVANGTDALEIALRAIGIRQGDTVLTVANAGCYATTASRSIGARLVYVDVDQSLNMSLSSLQEVISSNNSVKAVVVTHLYGQIANIEAIKNLLEHEDIPLIEDCAQAHGAEYNNCKAGSFGILSTFSFYPTKNLGAMGDGGAVLTSDSSLAQRVRSLSQYGWSNKYEIVDSGGRNSRLDEIQASILRLKLRHLDNWNSKRRSIVKQYKLAARSNLLRFPHDPESVGYVGHLCVVLHPERDAVMRQLELGGITTSIHYPILDYNQEAFSYDYRTSNKLDNSEYYQRQIFTLPCFPTMTEEEIGRVCLELSQID